jgi:hypothetical protein
MQRGTVTTGFHVTRLTEASLIVATPTHAAQPCALTQTAVVALGSRQSNNNGTFAFPCVSADGER